jgi:hypothetical protein
LTFDDNLRNSLIWRQTSPDLFNKSSRADASETRFDLFPHRERRRLNGKDNAIMLN